MTREGRKILDRGYLEADGEFPRLLSLNAQSFRVQDVIGELCRNKQTGEAILKQDSCGGKLWDRQGREVNCKGYLVDSSGNVIDQKGIVVFFKN